MKKQYTVVYRNNAREDLTALWVDSADRAAISAASDQIDQLLGDEPTRHGKHLREGLWKLTVEPLVVTFVVEPGDRLVRVWSVRMLEADE